MTTTNTFDSLVGVSSWLDKETARQEALDKLCDWEGMRESLSARLRAYYKEQGRDEPSQEMLDQGIEAYYSTHLRYTPPAVWARRVSGASLAATQALYADRHLVLALAVGGGVLGWSVDAYQDHQREQQALHLQTLKGSFVQGELSLKQKLAELQQLQKRVADVKEHEWYQPWWISTKTTCWQVVTEANTRLAPVLVLKQGKQEAELTQQGVTLAQQLELLNGHIEFVSQQLRTQAQLANLVRVVQLWLAENSAAKKPGQSDLIDAIRQAFGQGNFAIAQEKFNQLQEWEVTAKQLAQREATLDTFWHSLENVSGNEAARALYDSGKLAATKQDMAGMSTAIEGLQKWQALAVPTLELRITSRGKAGVSRKFDQTGSERRYLIVEPSDAAGNAVSWYITSQESKKSRWTDQFGLEVSNEKYLAVKKDKTEDGILDDAVVAKKPANSLSWSTPVTNTILEW